MASRQTKTSPKYPQWETGPGAQLSGLAFAVALAWGAVLPKAHANPTGGAAVAGQASFSTNGNQLLVTTQNAAGANHSAINWQSFSIPGGSGTYFQQPTAASTVINRVITNTPSQIFGTLGSNGNLVLVNQSGITVGAGAVVDTAGFTASALRMTDADALAGRLRFGDGTPGGGVTVAGSVLARSGDVFIIGSNVDTASSALISAPNGSTVLAAGQQIALTGRGLEGISLEVQAPQNSAVNLGNLKGDAVGIFASTLKNTGAIQATAVTSSGGRVFLKAADSAEVGGTIQAMGANDVGGQVIATADRVMLKSGAIINASGAKGGGEVLIGGGLHGTDARVTNAQFTTVEAGTQIYADATVAGNGGTVVVWAKDTTQAHGSISAKGGIAGGNGGMVETSAHYLDVSGVAVSASASKGNAGTWLLDPLDVTIGTTLAGSIVSTLNGGANVTIQTTASAVAGNGDIILGFGADIIAAPISAATLTLDAVGSIQLNANISASGASTLGVSLQAGNGINTTSGYGNITTNGGAVTFSNAQTISGLGSISTSNSTFTGGGNVSLTAAGPITLSGGSITTSGGNVVIQSTGAVISSAATIYSGGGLVDIDAVHGINLTGPIYSTSSADAGSVKLTSSLGDITTSDIFAYGAEGAVNGSSFSAGSVSIHATTGIVTAGAINAYGGGFAAYGGNGASVDIYAGALTRISSVGAINAAGGVGTPSTGMGGGISVVSKNNLSSGQLTTNGTISVSSDGSLSLIGASNGSTGASSVAVSFGSLINYGSLNSTGNVSITNTNAGTFNYGYGGSVTAASLTLAAPNGAVSQSTGINVGQLTVVSKMGASLNLGNSVSSFAAANTGTGDISLTNTGVLSILGVANAGGNVVIDNNGDVINQGLIAASGSVTVTARSPITVNGAITAGGNISLAAPTISPSSNITVNGNLTSTGGAIAVSAYNNVVQNSTFNAAGGVTVATQTGTVTLGPLANSIGAPLSYSQAGVSFTPVFPLALAQQAAAQTNFLASFLDQFQTALDMQTAMLDDPLGIKQRAQQGIVVEGAVCTP